MAFPTWPTCYLLLYSSSLSRFKIEFIPNSISYFSMQFCDL
jgi:hypothetical protein